MEQSYKEKYEDILARLERAKNDNDVCDERFCCVIDEIIPELAESDDERVKKRITLCLEECVHSDVIRDYEKDECIAWLEKQGQVKESTISQHEIETCKGNDDSLTNEDEKVRKEIINYFRCQSEEEPTRKEIHDKWIAWIENIPYTIDHEKREGFHLGYKAGLERGEKKSEENKGNIGGISPNWSEEDEKMLDSVIGDILNADTFLGGKETASYKCDWLKSIKDRVQPQPKQEWSEEDEEILRTILSDGIRGAELDMLQVNWLKSLRPQNRWKPSDEQMGCLSDAIEHYNSLGYPASKLKELLDDLKKLKEGKV